MKEAGVALLGGHSVEDDEPKYGLSVTGIVHPDKVMTNSGLEPGDRLVLTKPLGTGLISTAGKASMALPEHTAAMIASMCSLNRAASEVATQFGLKACTDITGFGLAGHLVEMARAGKRALRVYTAAIPVLPGALEAAQNGLVPGGTYANRKFFGKWAKVDSATPLYFSDLVFDPQTSGGLVLGVPAEKTDQFIAALHAAGVTIAAVIGEVTGSDSEGVVDIV
jgi:selenide,water dikinase